MNIKVRLFAAQREATGQSSCDIELPAGARAADALEAVCARFPQLRPSAARVVLAVNQSQTSADALLADGDELALLPPMAGG